MGRKNKTAAVYIPFCYYCDQEFEDVNKLQQHQKSRHFSCPDCQKKFSTAFSMSTHASQLHKITITKQFNLECPMQNPEKIPLICQF